MRNLATILAITALWAAVPHRSNAVEFPEVDVSVRWSTVGAFEAEFSYFAERHYSDRLNPEIGFHLLPFLTLTGEYAFCNMSRSTALADTSQYASLDSTLVTHTAAIGARFHPKWRGVLLPFARVVVGISRATVTLDASEGGHYGFWQSSDTRPELTLSAGTEILFPRGTRERSHQALGGKASRMIRNGTIGLVVEAGHVFAPEYDLGQIGALGIGEFTFEMGFVAHF